MSHRSRDEDGFTLIELLVVVVILGVLIAIAIPVYLNYRRTAYDRAAQSDLRSTLSVLQLCYSDNGAFPDAATFTSGASAGSSGQVCIGRPGPVSSTTTLTYFPVSATDRSDFIIGASAGSSGAGKTYCFNSAQGGAVTATSTAVTRYRASC